MTVNDDIFTIISNHLLPEEAIRYCLSLQGTNKIYTLEECIEWFLNNNFNKINLPKFVPDRHNLLRFSGFDEKFGYVIPLHNEITNVDKYPLYASDMTYNDSLLNSKISEYYSQFVYNSEKRSPNTNELVQYTKDEIEQMDSIVGLLAIHEQQRCYKVISYPDDCFIFYKKLEMHGSSRGIDLYGDVIMSIRLIFNETMINKEINVSINVGGKTIENVSCIAYRDTDEKVVAYPSFIFINQLILPFISLAHHSIKICTNVNECNYLEIGYMLYDNPRRRRMAQQNHNFVIKYLNTFGTFNDYCFAIDKETDIIQIVCEKEPRELTCNNEFPHFVRNNTATWYIDPKQCPYIIEQKNSIIQSKEVWINVFERIYVNRGIMRKLC